MESIYVGANLLSILVEVNLRSADSGSVELRILTPEVNEYSINHESELRHAVELIKGDRGGIRYVQMVDRPAGRQPHQEVAMRAGEAPQTGALCAQT
jgi:hypothetical protein